ncbi:MAG: phosphatase PAP2 family protein [Bacilli bacterium]
MKKLWDRINRNWKLIIFIISLIIFLYFIKSYCDNDIEYYDKVIYNFISSFQSNTLNVIMKIITSFCHTFLLCLITLLILVFIKKRSYGLYTGLNLISAWLFNSFVKILVQRPRPIDINLITETGFSFPSGHAMVSTAFYGLFIYIIAHLNIKKSIKIVSCCFLVLLIFFIGVSRIYLGVHYASDVLGGFSLGCAYLMLFIRLFYKDMIKAN